MQQRLRSPLTLESVLIVPAGRAPLTLSPPCPGRNAASRGGQGVGPMATFNRSTEDLRLKQQPSSYGRLRESETATAELLPRTFARSWLTNNQIISNLAPAATVEFV